MVKLDRIYTRGGDKGKTSLGDGTRVRTPADLRRHYAALGVDDATAGDTIAYCGSGVSACMNVLAMEHADVQGDSVLDLFGSGWGHVADHRDYNGLPRYVTARRMGR